MGAFLASPNPWQPTTATSTYYGLYPDQPSQIWSLREAP